MFLDGVVGVGVCIRYVVWIVLEVLVCYHCGLCFACLCSRLIVTDLGFIDVFCALLVYFGVCCLADLPCITVDFD